MQLFRDVDIPLKRFRLLMHNQSLGVNQVDLMDSTASLVDYYDRGVNGSAGGDRRPDYQSSKQLNLMSYNFWVLGSQLTENAWQMNGSLIPSRYKIQSGTLEYGYCTYVLLLVS